MLMLLITALAWIYVVLLMALTEPTVVAGVMTFLMYCVVPLGILLYVTGGKARKRRRERANATVETVTSTRSDLPGGP
jgi:hypothetical protein